MSAQLRRGSPRSPWAQGADLGAPLPAAPLAAAGGRAAARPGADRRRLSEAASRFFTPAGVEMLRSMVEGTAEEVAESFARQLSDGHACGLWAHFALPLAARVACGTVGIAAEDVGAVVPIALAVAGLPAASETEAARAEALFVLRRYLDERLALHAGSGGDDITSLLLADASGGLTHDEIRQVVGGLIVAGVGPVARAATRAVRRALEGRRWPSLSARRAAADAAGETLAAHPLLEGWPGIGAGGADGAPCLDHLARITVGAGLRFLAVHVPGLVLAGAAEHDASVTVASL